MAAILPIVINDGQTVPVPKTFNPLDSTSLIALWGNREGGIATGMPTVSVSVSMADPMKESSVTRVNGKVTLPVLEVISNGSAVGYSPLPKVAYTVIGKFEFSMPGRATNQQRRDILAFTRNFLQNAQITSAVIDFERPW